MKSFATRKITPLLVLSAFCISFQGCAERTFSHRPNFILVAVDTLRWDRVGMKKRDGLSITPSLDALAADGITFSNASSTSPWTLPSFASILSSSFPSVHGAGGRFQDSFHKIDKSLALSSTVFGAEGYRTAAVLNGPFLSPVFELNRGFESYDFIPGNNLKIRRASSVVRSVEKWITDTILAPAEPPPFHLFIQFFDPHLNYDPPGRFLIEDDPGYEGALSAPFGHLEMIRSGELDLDKDDELFIASLYDSEIAYTDHHIGLFFEFLKENGLYDNSLIVFTSDHGEEFWEHGGFEHGHTLYDELIHVPLIMKLPGAGQSGSVIAEPVSLVDILPTALEIAEIESTGTMQGVSLVPLISGKGDLQGGKRAVYSEANLYGARKRSVRLENYKYIIDTESGTEELYDLEKDPGEQENIASTERAKKKDLTAELDRIHSLCLSLAATGTGAEDAESYPEDRAPGEGIDDPEILESLKSLGYVD